MIKGINKLLRLVGLNLVRAKRKKVARRILVIDGSIPVGDECVNEFNAENAGRTHYVGDNCPGGHLSQFPGQENCCLGVPNHDMTRVEQPNSDNKISGPTS